MAPFSLRIIIIDDEECIRDSLAIHLSGQGHEVLSYKDASMCPALNGHDCRVKGPCADIVFVDQNLPGINGLELLKTLTMHGCQTLPGNRFLMTGDATPELEKKVRGMGCHVIQKPLHLDKLDELIEQARVFISADRTLSEID